MSKVLECGISKNNPLNGNKVRCTNCNCLFVAENGDNVIKIPATICLNVRFKIQCPECNYYTESYFI